MILEKFVTSTTGTQSVHEAIGKSGCYFLSIVLDGDITRNIIDLYRECVQSGFMDSDCYVRDPVKIYNLVHTKKASRCVVQDASFLSDFLGKDENGQDVLFVVGVGPNGPVMHFGALKRVGHTFGFVDTLGAEKPINVTSLRVFLK